MYLTQDNNKPKTHTPKTSPKMMTVHCAILNVIEKAINTAKMDQSEPAMFIPSRIGRFLKFIRDIYCFRSA